MDFEDGDTRFWNPVLRLLRAPGMFVVHESFFGGPADSMGTATLDIGSTTYFDPLFDFNTTNSFPSWIPNGGLPPGNYVIEVADEFGGIPDGVDYDLHFSVEGHTTASFLFQPSPIFEDEAQQLPAQDIDAADNFGTFYDPAVGAGVIDYNTPYAKIVGSGDGSHDTFQFEVTPAMLNPDAGTISGDIDTSTYYTAIDLNLNQTGATTSPGDVWQLAVNGKSYSYTSKTGDSLASVATGLAQGHRQRHNHTRNLRRIGQQFNRHADRSAGFPR